MQKVAAYLDTAFKILFHKVDNDARIVADYTIKEIEDAIDFKFIHKCEQRQKFIWRKGFINELFKILKKKDKSV